MPRIRVNIAEWGVLDTGAHCVVKPCQAGASIQRRLDRPNCIVILHDAVNRRPSLTDRTGQSDPPKATDPTSIVISSFQVAEGMGLKGELRQWEHLLRVAE
jgi:hypothetical protein